MSQKICTLLTTAALIGCTGSGGYIVTADEVTYRDRGSNNSALVYRAKPATFSVLNDLYGKDSDNVYYTQEIVFEADVESFVLDSRTIGHDSSQIFREGKPYPACDAKTFHHLKFDWYADSKCVYDITLTPRVVKGADPNTFVPVTEWLGKDKLRAYAKEEPIEGSDGPSFVSDCRGSVVNGKDKNQCYWYEYAVPCDCKPHTDAEF